MAKGRYCYAMATFLFKTEPADFSYADLAAATVNVWDGVANAQAVAVLRTIKQGDEVLIYHTGVERAVVGLAVVIKGAYADPKQPGLTAKGEIKVPVVGLKAVKAAKVPVTLAAIKADARFADWALVRQGRLSVMPVAAGLDEAIRAMAGL